MRVNERTRDIGNFLLGRLLPVAKKRQVGPFTFIDHMGPSQMGPEKLMGVDQHPHIGLSTLTYLFEGEIEHRDSTGAAQRIGPGDVGFMTAGKGVTHTERSPKEWHDGKIRTMHGYQIWVALPIDQEEIEPTFQFIPKAAVPVLQRDGLTIKVAAGEAFGLRSPLKVYSDLFMVDVFTEEQNTLDLFNQVKGEIAIVVVAGSVIDGEDTIEAGQMLISKTEDECKLDLAENTQLLLFGGQPFPEERFLHWNFVSHSKERLEKAKDEWVNKRFPKVPGDNTYIPLP